MTRSTWWRYPRLSLAWMILAVAGVAVILFAARAWQDRDRAAINGNSLTVLTSPTGGYPHYLPASPIVVSGRLALAAYQGDPLMGVYVGMVDDQRLIYYQHIEELKPGQKEFRVVIPAHPNIAGTTFWIIVQPVSIDKVQGRAHVPGGMEDAADAADVQPVFIGPAGSKKPTYPPSPPRRLGLPYRPTRTAK